MRRSSNGSANHAWARKEFSKETIIDLKINYENIN